VHNKVDYKSFGEDEEKFPKCNYDKYQSIKTIDFSPNIPDLKVLGFRS